MLHLKKQQQGRLGRFKEMRSAAEELWSSDSLQFVVSECRLPQPQ